MNGVFEEPNIAYYNRNAAEFAAGTLAADMSTWRDRFLSYLPAGGFVLDAGCGSGRDSRVFLDRGFRVEAFDASGALCRLAEEYLGQRVSLLRFEDAAYPPVFDGVWACASLLHVKRETLPDVLRRLRAALKEEGVLYASFKYGEGETENGGRRFTNMTEAGIAALLESAGFSVLETGVTEDVRPGRQGEYWTNAIAEKRAAAEASARREDGRERK